jgi:hypothetical protein
MDHSANNLTVYPTLERNRIRIITIQPGQFDDDITIILSPVKFSERKPLTYEALSYVWARAVTTNT